MHAGACIFNQVRNARGPFGTMFRTGHRYSGGMQMLLMTQRFNSFDQGGSGMGEVFVAGSFLFVVVGIVVRLLVAGVIFQLAGELKAKNEGPFLFPPLLWALFSLAVGSTGQVLVVGLFVACHFTSWIDLSRANFERQGRQRGKRASLTEKRESAHRKKMRALQTEMDQRKADGGSSE